MTSKTILIALFITTFCLYSSHSHVPLIKKARSGKQQRRRLSLLMDSFVDPARSNDYFYAVLYVGSQSQRVEIALDTGSGLPYFACSSTCTHCGQHDDKPYITENSTSFEWIACKEREICGTRPTGRCKDDICEWTSSYADGSSISSLVGSDLISFYQYPDVPVDYYRIPQQTEAHSLPNEKKLRLSFGCSEREANTIYKQGADGIMGLSMDQRSFVDQLFNVNAARLGSRQFAHCFGDNTGGLLLFGSVEIDDLMNRFNIKPIWTAVLKDLYNPKWYTVNTTGFVVRQNNRQNNGSIAVNYTSDPLIGYHGSVVDTGSSTLSMPRKPAEEIKNAISQLANAALGEEHAFEWEKDGTKHYDYLLKWNGKTTFDDAEWKQFSDEFMKFFPDIVMLWKGDAVESRPLEFSVPVQRYLLYKTQQICLDIFGDTPSVLVGSNVMVNKFMIYDQENMKLGVADVNCDALVTQNTTKQHTLADNTTQKHTFKETPGTPAISMALMDRDGATDHVVVSQMDSVYLMYAKYSGLLLFSGFCVYCMCIRCKKWIIRNNHRWIMYHTVSTADPDHF
eukprot:254484_1